ncbi:MAG: twin-arginine translocation signal domain-containing protein, partial [bacterium]|nr:twin-arginine translocation signal domain-containing protein [bacterium]
MAENNDNKLDRREFLKQSAIAAAAIAVGLDMKPGYAAKRTQASVNPGKKVIVIGIDGMDPRLSEQMMDEGHLPNFAKLRKQGGYRRLGTSIPPQSPVAWANFINGAGPGSHGIYDFIHRNPEKQCAPFFSAAETLSGLGYWEIGDHKLQLDFWPFNHQQAMTLLRRQGIPFWDYLDEAGIRSVFYDLPSNYPPSPSKHGNHRCLSGMGTPDMLGTYGTYQHFAEDGPVRTKEEGGGKRSMVFFENETAKVELIGPRNDFLKNPQPAAIEFEVHRDKQARAAVIEIQNQKILLKEGQWSRWIKLDFEMVMPVFMQNEHFSGICRFYLQEVEPNFRLYVSPINTDPSNPA